MNSKFSFFSLVVVLALFAACTNDLPTRPIGTLCEEGATREGAACGVNGRGHLTEICIDGIWTAGDDCVDPDECKNGTWKIEEGVAWECAAGKWTLRRITKQWGTEANDFAYGVAIDSAGNVFITGTTDGTLDGNPSTNSRDIFLTKWNTDGTKAWTRVWGTEFLEWGYAVAIDAADNIFVAGVTYGSLDGNVNQVICGTSGVDCTTDIFLTKWNADGTKAWTKQWGTAGADEAYDLAVDSSGNIHVSGKMIGLIDNNEGIDCDISTEGIQPCAPIFLTKWNADGTYAWTRQWGADHKDWGMSVAIDDNGAAFVTGNTNGDLKGNSCIPDTSGNCSGDIFLTKWNADTTTEGANSWTHLWGATEADYGTDIAVDHDGNVFVVGYASGPLGENAIDGMGDLFITKFDSEGSKLWTRQWGSASYDFAKAVTVDKNGDVLVAGTTTGSLDGLAAFGAADVFLTKWYTDGTKAWTRQWGTIVDDNGRSVTVDSAGRIFVAGFTAGTLDGNTLLGETDIFLTIFPPESLNEE